MYILSVLTILSFSTFLPALAYAAPRDSSDKDWINVNGNSWAWNYSPQAQINKDNVDNLEMKWIFPVGSKSLAPAGMQAVRGLAEGATTPPIVRDGRVFITTNWMRTYGIDAKSGKQIWTNDYTINPDDIAKRLPWSMGGILHLHGFNYWAGGDALLLNGMACDFYGVEAKTGKTSFWVQDLCKDVPGNLYSYRPSPSNTATIGIYEKGKQFIVVVPGRMHSTLFGGDSRHITVGVNIDSKQVMWRVYSSPPQDQIVKDWALQECDIGFFQTYPCKDVAAKNRAGLEWDFALPNEKPSKWGGVTANWGQMVVDEDTGILYTQTGNQGPYSNMTMAPGPRLYGSTIMAIDMNQGKRVWWLQPFPHDPYDYDCNWSGMLVDNPTLGKVYIKGCKEGIYYVMDAKTGTPKYARDVVNDMAARGQIMKTLNGPAYKYYRPDPFSYHDLREWNWISYPAKAPDQKGERFTLPTQVFPSFYNGLFATDMSFDPETQTLFDFEAAAPIIIRQEFPYIEGKDLFTTAFVSNTNETIVARDLATGNVKWTWFYSYSQTRAAMVISGGMVFTGFTDGNMRFLDKNTGKMLKEMNLGAPIVVQPTIGKDTDGNSKIFVIIGATRLGGVNQFGLAGQDTIPGTLIALGLSEKAAKTTTVTSTSATTSTTTATTTVVSTQPARTTTVTSQITETVGLPSEVTYAAVAVAVIAVIAAAVLTMRKKA